MAVLQSTLKLTLLDQVSARARGIMGVLNGLQRQQSRFMSPLTGITGQLMALTAGYLGVTQGFQTTIGAAMSFESAFADVKKVVEATPEQFENMARSIRAMSTTLPTTANDLAALYAAAGESGVATNDLNAFALMAARVGIAFDMTAGEAGDSLAKLKTQLGLTVAETGEMADVINYLSNNMASKASDVTNYMLRVGALAKMAGFTKEEVAALGSAMISAGAPAETAATAMQNVAKAMTRGKFAKKGQIAAAKALGLDLPTLAKQMQKDAPAALKKVLTAIGKAPKDQHMALLSEFFGDEAKAFAPLVGNIGLLDQALDSVADKTKYAGSAFKEYVERSKTTANVLDILKNKFVELGRSIGDDMLPGMKDGALAIGQIIDTLGERATIVDKLSTAVSGFTNGLGLKGGIKEAIASLGDLLLGPANGSEAADTLGRIFAKFKEWGASVREFSDAIRDNPVAKFIGELGGLGFKFMASAVGIGLMVGVIKRLAGALYFLSGASTAVAILKTIADMQNVLNGAGAAGNVRAAAAVSGTAFGVAFAAAAGAAIAAGLLVTLRELDPKGDLAGLTKPIDDWFEKNTGWNPAKDGLSFGDVSDGLRNLLPGMSGIKRLMDWAAHPSGEKPVTTGAGTVAEQVAIDNATRASRNRSSLVGRGTSDTSPGKTKDDLFVGFPKNLSAVLDTARRAAAASKRVDNQGEASAANFRKRGIDTWWLNRQAVDATLRRRAFENSLLRPEVKQAQSSTNIEGNVSALVALENAIRSRSAGLGGTTDTLPGKTKDDLGVGAGPKVVSIDAGSIAAMIQPTGVQQVTVTNPVMPNVTVSAPITINGVLNPQAAANAAASELGSKVKEAVNASFGSR